MILWLVSVYISSAPFHRNLPQLVAMAELSLSLSVQALPLNTLQPLPAQSLSLSLSLSLLYSSTLLIHFSEGLLIIPLSQSCSHTSLHKVILVPSHHMSMLSHHTTLHLFSTLRWFSLIERMENKEFVQVFLSRFEGPNRRGRPLGRWEDRVKENLSDRENGLAWARRDCMDRER